MQEIVPAGELFETGKPDLNTSAPPGDTKMLSVILPAVVSLIGMAVSAGTAAKNRKFQKEQQLAQQEYDSPAAQMQRMKDAGLNPNLVAGQIGSGNFGQSPDPLPDMGQLVSRAGNDAFQGVNSLMQLKQSQLNLELMQERVNQVRLSNDFASMSMGDRFRLLVANLLSANQTNDLRQFDLDFAKWYNGPNIQKYRFEGSDASAYDVGPVMEGYPYYQSPREIATIQDLNYSNVRYDKVQQDYWNAIKQHDYLTAQIVGAELGNDRQRIARDFERNAKQPWGQTRPLDRLLNYLIDGLIGKYGDQIMQKIYGWIDGK